MAYKLEERMRFRKLRIAWSVGCGVTCVLLIALWLRSYSRLDGMAGPTPDGFGFQVYSTGGRIVCSKGSPAGATEDSSWQLNLGSEPPSEETEAGNFLFRGFGLLREPCASGIFLPHWFLVGLFAALAISLYAPWRWRIQHMHFSLSTLLIATTLVAVVMGLAVYAARN